MATASCQSSGNGCRLTLGCYENTRIARGGFGSACEIALLAAPADEQVTVLARKNFPVVELAQGFWDWYDKVPLLVENGVITDVSVNAVARVDSAIRAIDRASAGPVGSPCLWTEESLQTDERWAEVRAVASDALTVFADLGVPSPSPSDPTFFGAREDAP